MPKGELRISAGLLMDLVHLDECGYKTVSACYDTRLDQLVLQVEHPDLPEPKDGQLPTVLPRYRRDTQADGTIRVALDRIVILTNG